MSTEVRIKLVMNTRIFLNIGTYIPRKIYKTSFSKLQNSDCIDANI